MDLPAQTKSDALKLILNVKQKLKKNTFNSMKILEKIS